MALIDQQEAVEGVRELFSLGDCFCDEYSIVGMLNSLPTQEIIHCKDCKRWDNSMDMFEVVPYCHRLETDTRANDFCAWAEKR